MSNKLPDPSSEREFQFAGKDAAAVLAIIQKDAVAALSSIRRGTRADIARAAINDLQYLSDKGAPPQALVDLIAKLIGVKRRARAQPRDHKKRDDVARFLAESPDATETLIRRKFKVDPRVLRRWQNDPEFVFLRKWHAQIIAARKRF